jgi:hypothetical protein
LRDRVVGLVVRVLRGFDEVVRRVPVAGLLVRAVVRVVAAFLAGAAGLLAGGLAVAGAVAAAAGLVVVVGFLRVVEVFVAAGFARVDRVRGAGAEAAAGVELPPPPTAAWASSRIRTTIAAVAAAASAAWRSSFATCFWALTF